MGNFLGDDQIAFGDFELDPRRRLLMRGGETVPLGGKAFDLLLALIENRDEVVTKEFLLETVWEGQFVEENNLTVHIAAIRKALGERKGEHRYVVTVPGKGYRFVSALREEERHDIVVETREVRSILVEEYEEEQEGPAPAPVLQLTGGTQRRWWRWAIVPGLLLITGAAWSLLSGRQEAKPRFDAATMTSRVFSVPGAVPQRVALSPDGRTIAFASRANGRDSLWVGDLETSASRQLTEWAERLHNALQFSPDGKTLYFTVKDANHPVWTLMSISASGGAVSDFGVELDGDLSLSPDSKHIAHFSGGTGNGQTLSVRPAVGNGESREIYRPTEGQRFSSSQLAWSPAGRITVIVGDERKENCSFLDVDPSNGAAKVLARLNCVSVVNFEWFAGGSELAIIEELPDDARRAQIRILDPATGRKRELTNDAFHYTALSLSTSPNGRVAALEIRNLLDIAAAGSDTGPTAEKMLNGGSSNEGAHGVAAAPDGKILYTVKVGTSRAIWEMNPDGTGARELIKPQEGREDMQISVTADNRFVVFDSNRTGKWEVWRANRDGTGAAAMTSGGDNCESAVTPDGQFVVYHAVGNGNKGIWRMPVGGGQAEPLIRDECSWPDVSPDGRWIACATGANSDGAKRKLQIYNMENGELRRSFSVTMQSILYNRLRWAPHGRSVVYKDLVDGLWEQSLDGDSPQRISGFDSIRVFHLNRIGGELLYSGGKQGRNIVIVEPSAAAEH
jgi:DNA-binding winged helix-turn-helix (wHTH) protein/Tol biopolymer transport system component